MSIEVKEGSEWMPNFLLNIFSKFDGLLGKNKKRIFLTRKRVLFCDQCLKEEQNC